MTRLLTTLTLSLTAPLGAADDVDFNRDIRPILSDRCFHCHGPDAHDRKGKLRLDTTGGPDGAYRTLDGSTAIKPGDPDASEVWHRITTTDEDEVMPPPKSHKPALTDREKDLVRRWIGQGATYQDFWAFVPPEKPAEPQVKNTAWSDHPVDRFVLRKLEAENLTPNPPAGPRALARRLHLDLTGLPPTRDELHAFLADTAPGAVERLADRLLAKPQYGEHMAKYWLDLVRFADTNGIHHDHYREMSPYRNWVIRAFNDNLSYDKFSAYQLAGDLFPYATTDQLVASGFNRLHLIIDVGTALPEESLHRNIVDRVTAVGTAFMGLTVQCAVCHDHKYDPVTMKDFYALSAFFNNLDATPETGGRSGTSFKRGLQPPFIELPNKEQKQQLAELDKKIAAAADDAEKKKLRSQRDSLMLAVPAAMVMKERNEIRPAHLLVRGAYDNPAEEVARNTPEFLPPLETAGGLPSRLDLARWFTDPQNPLTARVAVNRFWQQLFGTGIVKTAEDFGAQGEWPSHPDLLDHLTVLFTGSGWDVKALVKHIVTSKTYQQSSAASPDAFAADPENRRLARGSRFRMDSEMVRDSILATSGLLNSKMFGTSVKIPQPAGLWKAVGMPSSYPSTFNPDDAPQIYRRSVYTFWKRGMPPPQMTILNAPTREACTARRERTNTPLQALLLLNEQEYLRAARHLAASILTDQSLDPGSRIDALYETITSKLPDQAERTTLLDTLTDLHKTYSDTPELATLLCENTPVPAGNTHIDLAAWTLLTSSIYNLDITKTRQ